MSRQFTEDQLLVLRVALNMLKECKTAEEVYARVDEFRELGIDYEPVGVIARMRLELFGVDSRNEQYMEVERFFGFKTVMDYAAERREKERQSDSSVSVRFG